MHWQILYQFSPTKRFITNDQRFMGSLSIFYVFKHLYRLILLHTFSSFVFFPQPRFHKPYPQSKTFLNIRAVPINAIFCSNAMLMTTSSSSVQISSFFGVLSSAPTITGMTLLFLVLLLCQHFTFAHNMRYCFLFLATHSKSDDWVVLPIFCFT